MVLVQFCDWRGLIKESSVEPEAEPSQRFNLLFTEGSGIQGTFINTFSLTTPTHEYHILRP